ncbi:MAG: serine--tRNA ligase [Phycicoccus sp.]|nr:serine--tRNA ligase [Phycicoccus sp.]
MIDIRLVRDQPDIVRASQRARGEDESVVDQILQADTERRTSLTAFENLRAEQKVIGKDVARAQGEEKQALLAKTKQLAADVKTLQAASDDAQVRLDTLMRTIGNVVEPDVPVGGEDDYVVLDTVGTPRDFAAEGFEPKDHLDLAEGLDAIDMARGVKVAQSRFYFLKGVGARLEMAMLGLAMQKAIAAGFVPMITPTLVNRATMAGAGFIDHHLDEVYHLPADDLFLTGTSEVALAGYHADEIIDLSAGPIRYAGQSTCYRREAGSYGKDTRGIIRVHQFNKIEMFVYCRPDEAAQVHRELLAHEQDMLAAIEVPYRIIDTAAGDLGGPAARKFDCEAWVPTQGKYRELTSTSNCTTFQARRLGTRFKGAAGNEIAATLNGTLATTRWLVAILENHQKADGSVVVPEALRPGVGLDVLTPR